MLAIFHNDNKTTKSTSFFPKSISHSNVESGMNILKSIDFERWDVVVFSDLIEILKFCNLN